MEPGEEDGTVAPGRLDATVRQDAAARDAAVPGRDAAPSPGRDAALPADSGRAAFDASSPVTDNKAWTAPAPRASCREGDRKDDALSGLNGDFRCNLDVIGQVPAPHFLSLAWHDDCAYVNGPDGTTVIRVAEDGTPTVTTTLTTLGFRSNWESMKASPVSGLLVGYESNGSTLAVYDVARDCAQPTLVSSIQLGPLGSLGHAGSFSPDGTLYYASSFFTGSVYAVDLAVPERPVVVSETFERGSHDLFIGQNGTRGYFAYSRIEAYLEGGIVAIMDLSDIQARKPGATGTLIHEFVWKDGAATQYPIAVRYGGRDHLIITDELGSGNCNDPEKPQWGYAHVFDIANERAPSLVSIVKTEAQHPGHCEQAGQANGGTGGFGLGTHYCNVDRLEQPRVLACGNWDAGLRVYDIRDPRRPRELAYFDTPTANMPGLARIQIERKQLWIAVTPGTFYVLNIAPDSELATILGQD
ncbi:MAG: hypothetical protein ABW352_12095 [Polyangiales bacterium]